MNTQRYIDSLGFEYVLVRRNATELSNIFKAELESTGLKWQDFVPENSLKYSFEPMPIEAYENSFVVCSASNVDDLSTYALIDGFNRLIVNDGPNIEVFVKVYTDLNFKQLMKLYHMFNSWKLAYKSSNVMSGGYHYFSRGLSYFLYKSLSFKPMLKEYVYTYFIENRLAEILVSDFFENDLRTLVFADRAGYRFCMSELDDLIKTYRFEPRRDWKPNLDLSWEQIFKFLEYPEVKNLVEKLKTVKNENKKWDLGRALKDAFEKYVLKGVLDEQLKNTLNNDVLLKQLVKITDVDYFKDKEDLLRSEPELYWVTKNGANTSVERVEYTGIKRLTRGGITVFRDTYHNYHTFSVNGESKYRIIAEDTVNSLSTKKNTNNRSYLAKRKKK